MKENKRTFDIISYFAIILLAILFLYVGNKIASRDFVNVNIRYGNVPSAEVEITNILSTREYYETFHTTFEADVIKGVENKEITARQLKPIDGTKVVEEGDRVIVSREWDTVTKRANTVDLFEFAAYLRIDKILLFGGAFIVFMLLFCRIKGLNAILSLGLTCASIITILIPSLLSGKNIYISAMVVCIFSVTVTLFIVNGINKKSFAAVTGCFGGVIAAGVLTLIMSKVLGLTGLLNYDSRQLLIIYNETPIDLKGIVFAGIIIGAVGAITDTAMSISSALWELKTKAPDLTFKNIFKSGINIGQDLLGTMADTLVLAYVGNSLSFILIYIVYSKSFAEFINKEIVIVELLNIITGSFGVLLSMPFTALICAMLYSKNPVPAAGSVDKIEA